jgi:hypothetical protein
VRRFTREHAHSSTSIILTHTRITHLIIIPNFTIYNAVHFSLSCQKNTLFKLKVDVTIGTAARSRILIYPQHKALWDRAPITRPTYCLSLHCLWHRLHIYWHHSHPQKQVKQLLLLFFRRYAFSNPIYSLPPQVLLDTNPMYQNSLSI